MDGPFAMPVFGLLLIFLGTIRVPMMVYLYWVHSAWSWHYLFDPARVSGIPMLIAVLVQCLVLLGTWYLGAYFLRSERRRAMFYVLGGSVLALIIAALALKARLTIYGSYQAYVDGRTAGLMQVKLGYVIIALLLGLCTAAAYVSVELARDARRARAL